MIAQGVADALTWQGTLASLFIGLLVGIHFFGRLWEWTPRLSTQVSIFLTSAWYVAVLFDISVQGDEYLLGRALARLFQAIFFGVAVGVGVLVQRRLH